MNPPDSAYRSFIAASCLAVVSFAGTSRAQPAGYPSKTIRVVVPFPAGGLVDGMARVLMPEISKSIG